MSTFTLTLYNHNARTIPKFELYNNQIGFKRDLFSQNYYKSSLFQPPDLRDKNTQNYLATNTISKPKQTKILIHYISIKIS